MAAQEARPDRDASPLDFFDFLAQELLKGDVFFCHVYFASLSGIRWMTLAMPLPGGKGRRLPGLLSAQYRRRGASSRWTELTLTPIETNKIPRSAQDDSEAQCCHPERSEGSVHRVNTLIFAETAYSNQVVWPSSSAMASSILASEVSRQDRDSWELCAPSEFST